MPQASASGMEEGAADGGAGLAAAGTGSSSSNSPAALPCALSSACSAKVAQLRAAGRVTGMMEFDAISAHDAAYGLSSASAAAHLPDRRMPRNLFAPSPADGCEALASGRSGRDIVTCRQHEGSGAWRWSAAAAAGREEESTARPKRRRVTDTVMVLLELRVSTALRAAVFCCHRLVRREGSSS